MDLADIRKKAKKAQPGPGGQPPAAETSAAGEAVGTVAEDLPLEADSGHALVPGAPVGDRLEELFRFSGDLELATEEAFLQSLSGNAAREGAEDLRQWLTFTLGSEDYALDIRQISEIIKPREITEVPRAPAFILGVISLRGIVVPIFDLRQRLQLGRIESTAASRIVVCRVGERMAGMLVDRINQVIKIPAESIEPPPTVLTGIDRDLVEGVGRHQKRMLILLHLASVLNAELV